MASAVKLFNSVKTNWRATCSTSNFTVAVQGTREATVPSRAAPRRAIGLLGAGAIAKIYLCSLAVDAVRQLQLN